MTRHMALTPQELRSRRESDSATRILAWGAIAAMLTVACVVLLVLVAA